MILGASFIGTEGIDSALHAWTERIPKLWTEDALHTLPLDEFDMNTGFTLRQDSVFRKSEKAPSVGTHCGKVF